MGCGASKFDSEDVTVPARIRPLLRRRFEEIRNRRKNGAALKDSPSRLSKKELLKDGVSDQYDNISSPTHDFERKSVSSLEDTHKVAPEENVTISKEPVKEPFPVKSAKVAPAPVAAPEPEKVTKQQKSIKWNCNKDHEDKDGVETMPTAAIFTAVKAIKTSVHVSDERHGDKHEEEDDRDIGRLSSITADSLCPGSPSFRVYFIESLANIKDEDELLDHADKDDDFDKKSHGEDSSETTESRNSNVDSEMMKIKKKPSRGSRLRRVIPKGRAGAVKNLLNVKSCYNPACAGHDHARLLANKADA